MPSGAGLRYSDEDDGDCGRVEDDIAHGCDRAMMVVMMVSPYHICEADDHDGMMLLMMMMMPVILMAMRCSEMSTNMTKSVCVYTCVHVYVCGVDG